MQELKLLENNKTYKVTCASNLSMEQITDLCHAMDLYGEREVEFKGIEESRDGAKYNFIKAMESLGVNKIESSYYTVVLIPGNEIEKEVLDEDKVKKLIEECGLDLSDYLAKKTVKRKSSIRFGEK